MVMEILDGDDGDGSGNSNGCTHMVKGMIILWW